MKSGHDRMEQLCFQISSSFWPDTSDDVRSHWNSHHSRTNQTSYQIFLLHSPASSWQCKMALKMVSPFAVPLSVFFNTAYSVKLSFSSIIGRFVVFPLVVRITDCGYFALLTCERELIRGVAEALSRSLEHHHLLLAPLGVPYLTPPRDVNPIHTQSIHP